MFQGCCIKVFSRKQECPALSSAEAELCAMTENSKELVSLGMLLESILDGIPLTILGTPQCTTGTYHLVLRNDATAAISRVVATRPAHRTSCKVHSNAGEEKASFARAHPRTSKPE